MKLILSILLCIVFLTNTLPAFAAPTPVTIPNAEYRIVKLGENYAVSYNNDESIEYIGTSSIDLSSYINRRVIIEGEYKGLPPGGNSAQCEVTKQQCIRGMCHQIFDNNADICNLVIHQLTIKN